MLLITAVVASLLALLQVRLAFNVIRLRRDLKISVGDGEDDSLLRAIRAHANLSEYAPLAVLLLGCFEFNGAPLWLTALIGAAILAGRWLHQVGMSANHGSFKARVMGMQLTLTSLIVLSVGNIVLLGWRLL